MLILDVRQPIAYSIKVWVCGDNQIPSLLPFYKHSLCEQRQENAL